MLYVVNNALIGAAVPDWDIRLWLAAHSIAFREITIDTGIETFEDQLPSKIILSAGPYSISEKKPSAAVYQLCLNSKIPVLGICFGATALLAMLDIPVRELTLEEVPECYKKGWQKEEIIHDQTGLFAGIPSPFMVLRANRLTFAAHPDIVITAATRNSEPMFYRHRVYLIQGVQFHPEHPATTFGDVFLMNFLQ